MIKNTLLVKMENIKKYKDELDNIKKLDKNIYNMKEAAEYFGCIASQLKGYYQNYKETLQPNVSTGDDKLIIADKTGMFMLGLLLNKKSKVSSKLYNVVNELIEKEAYIKEESEVSSKTFKTDTLIENKKAITEILTINQDTGKDIQQVSFKDFMDIVKDDELSFEEMHITKINKSTGESISVSKKDFFENIVKDLGLDEELVDTLKKVSNTCNCIKCITKREAEVKEEEAVEDEEQGSSLFDIINGIAEIFNNVIEEAGKEEENKEEDIIKDFIQKAIIDKTQERIDYEEQSCTCTKCLEENLNVLSHAIETASIENTVCLIAKNTLAKEMQYRCSLFNIPELEANIMIQKFLKNFNELDIESMILTYLIEKKELQIFKKRGNLRESIILLAKQVFEGNHEAAYHAISEELRYVIGVDMRTMRKEAKNPESYLDIILKYDAYTDAMSAIHTLLNEV